jgi:hypothetical protein
VRPAVLQGHGVVFIDRLPALIEKVVNEGDDPMSFDPMSFSVAAEPEPASIEIGNGGAGQRRIAVRARAGSAPGLFWLGGFP